MARTPLAGDSVSISSGGQLHAVVGALKLQDWTLTDECVGS